MHELVSVSKIA